MKNLALVNPETGNKEELADLRRRVAELETRYKIPYGCVREFHRSYGQRTSFYPTQYIEAKLEDQKNNGNGFPRIISHYTKQDLKNLYQNQ